jgi:hypothetical protein
MSGFGLKKELQSLYKRACADDIEFVAYVIRSKDGETEFHMEGEARALDVMYAFSRMAADVGEMVYAMPAEEETEEEEDYDGTSH